MKYLTPHFFLKLASIALFITLLHSTLASQELDNGLLMHFTFDDSTAVDITGNGYNGIMHGNIEFVDGVNGAGIRLNNEMLDDPCHPGQQEYIELPELPAVWEEGFSFSAFIDFGSNTTWERVIDFGIPNNKQVTIWFSRWGNSNGVYMVSFNNSQRSAIGYTDILPGTYTHYTSTISPDGVMSLYINGKLKDTLSGVYVDNEVRTSNFIGRSNFCDADFEGMMDEIRIYNRALSDSEVNLLYEEHKSKIGLLRESVNSELTHHLEVISTGWVQESVSRTNNIFSENAGVNHDSWTQYFEDFFSDHLLTDDLYNYLGYPTFFWLSDRVHRNLQSSLYSVAKSQIQNIFNNQDRNLVLDQSADLRQSIMNHSFFLIGLINNGVIDSLKYDMISFYEELFNQYPDILKKGKTLSEDNLPYTGALKWQSINNLMYALEFDSTQFNRITNIVGINDDDVRGPYKDLWNKHRILILDNNQFQDQTLTATEHFYTNVPSSLYNMNVITCRDFLFPSGFEPFPIKAPGVNVFGIDIEDCKGGNPFPDDVNPAYSNCFMEVLSHEVNHRVDAWVLNNDKFFLDRRNQLLEAAGLDDLEYLRSMVGGEFFQNAPQEFIASIANQYMTHSLETLNLALHRFNNSYEQPINQFLFFSNIYTAYTDTTNYYIIGPDAKVLRSQHKVLKNSDSYINHLYINENKWYRFFLDEENFVTGILEFNIQNNQCADANNGQISITPYGEQSFNFLWHDGDTTSFRTNLSEGIYDILVTDPEKNIAESFSFEIKIENLLQINFLDIKNPTCYGFSDGSASLELIGEGIIDEIEWDNGEQGITTNSLSQGIHSVTVTVENGCSVSGKVEINNPDSMKIDLLYLDDVTCPGFANGMAGISVSGGIPNYNITWGNGEQGTTAKFLSPGINEVEISDKNGCITTYEVEIKEPSPIDVSYEVFIDSLSSVELIAFGGTPPYSYLWNDPLEQETKFVSGLEAGIYEVLITDSNNCTHTIEINVSTTTHTQEINNFKLVDVYPNPTSEKVTISYKASRIIFLRITDIQGREIQSLAPVKNKEMVEIKGPEGMYFLHFINSNNNMKTIKVFKSGN